MNRPPSTPARFSPPAPGVHALAAPSPGGQRLGLGALAWALLAAGPGCAVESEPSRQEICAAAEDHASACLGEPTHLPADCDPEAATQLLDTPCAQLDDPGKADDVSEILCAAGSLRRCPTPACGPALPADHDFATDDCADLIELEGCAACDYYRCREAQSAGQCGGDGYYEGFGYKYCLRYANVTEPRMSDNGQAWSAITRRCLMEALDADVPDVAQCESLIDAGYGTHPNCYVETGFCDLPPSDWHHVVSTIDLQDQDFRQSLTVGLGCLSDSAS